MSGLEIKITGLDDVKRKFKQLPPKVAERVERLALRQGANLMLKQIRANAPVKTGRLRRAFKVRNSRLNRLNKNGTVGIYITLNRGKSRKDKNGAWYGPFVERGYNRGSKLLTGSQAVAAGVMTFGEYRTKRAALRANRRGKYAQGVRARTGGKSVEGQHFVRAAYEQTKERAARLIVDASKAAVDRITQDM